MDDRAKKMRLRERAAEGCRARFQGKVYKPGTHDCTRLALHALRGVKVPVPFAKGLTWKSEADGLKVLKGLGFDDLIQAVSGLGLARIAPAMAWPADLIALNTDHRLGALAVSMGNGEALAFTGLTDTCEVLNGFDLDSFARDDAGPIAWRVI